MSTPPRQSSDIPQARARLREVAHGLIPIHPGYAAEIIRIINNLMWRHCTPIPVARAKRPALTPHMAAQIRVVKANNPDMLQDEIGRLFNVPGGRVSEALAGHDRTPRRSQGKNGT